MPDISLLKGSWPHARLNIYVQDIDDLLKDILAGSENAKPPKKGDKKKKEVTCAPCSL